MNKSTFLLAVGSAFVFGLPLAASAYDDDPGYGPNRPWYGGEDQTYRFYEDQRYRHPNEPVFYRPTQRYYGKGYTVSYRYLPVFLDGQGVVVSSNFRTEAFRIATRDISNWRATPPRLVLPNSKPPKQNAITSIIPANSNSGSHRGIPGLLPSTSDPSPTPNLDPAIEAPKQ